MGKKALPVDCYIFSLSRRQESYLESEGFAAGLILFAIPSMGLLFKCRAEGDPLDLELAALASAVRFMKKSLYDQKIKTVKVHSSNPEFVFCLSKGQGELVNSDKCLKLLRSIKSEMDILVSYVTVSNNKALVSPTDYPSAPVDQKTILRPTIEERTRTSFKPIQKGITL